MKALQTMDYRELIKQGFDQRSARNPQYSFRAYARDIGISHTSLSHILVKKQGLSKTKAIKIANKLGLNPDEQEYFLTLIESEHARSTKQREIAQKRLKSFQPQSNDPQTPLHGLSLEAFKTIAEWYHFAILEIIETEGFEQNPTYEWIATELDLSLLVVKAAVDRLKKLEYIVEDSGKLRRIDGYIATPSGIPSEALKKRHTQILQKAITALHFQSIDERDFSSVTMPISLDDISWVKEEIKKFRRELAKKLSQSSKKQKVYNLSIQLFSLQKNSTPKRRQT